MPFKWTVETFRILPETDDVRLHEFLYQSGPIDYSTLNIDCNSNLKKSDEWKSSYKQNEMENNTVLGN